MKRKVKLIGTVALTCALVINQCSFFDGKIIKADAEEIVIAMDVSGIKPTTSPDATPNIKTTPTAKPTETPVEGEITNITNVVFRDPNMKVTKQTKFQLSDLVVTLKFASGEEYDTVNHPELEKYLQIQQVDCGNNRFLVNVQCALKDGSILNCTRYADMSETESVETERPEKTTEPEKTAEPRETRVPTVSQKPEETERPTSSQKPGETERPTLSQRPGETEKPTPSVKPTMSATPMVSVTPKVSATPVLSVTKTPQATPTGGSTVTNPIVVEIATPTPTPEVSIKVGDTFLYKNIKYKVIEYDTKNGGNVSLIGYNKSATSLTLADQVKYGGRYFKAVKIEKGVFKNAKNLKGSIKIPKHIVSIGDSAFEGCNRLTRVEIKSKVKKIGKKAFYNCQNVKKVVFNGKNLKNVGDSAFKKLHKKKVLSVPTEYMDYYRKLLKNKF